MVHAMGALGSGQPADIGAMFVLLFVVATAVAIAARRLSVPYPVALVVAGLFLGTLNIVNAPHLTQELLFAAALPGLVFEAAFNLRAEDLWRNWRTLFLLSVPGVAVAIALAAALTPVALAAAGVQTTFAAGELLVFAALISATDPVAVVALFRRLGAPQRLTLLVEAESLFNDATAIVFFLAALGLVAGSGVGAGAALGVVGRFILALVGGAVIGLLVGGAAALVIARVDDEMVEITLTVVAAYGSFAAAQQLGLSGVLATVAAGVLCGHDVARRGMSPTARVAVGTFWEYGAFALNSIVFLLMGFEVHFQGLVAAWRPVVAAFVVLLLCRGLVVGLVALVVRPTAERMPWQWGTVLTWGGLRGALSMVLALSLPAQLPHRALLVTMTFGVVTLSLIGQGLSMPAVLRRLRVTDDAAPRRHFEAAREEFRAVRAAVEELDYLVDAGVVPARVESALRARYGPRLTTAEARLRAAVERVDQGTGVGTAAGRPGPESETGPQLAATAAGLDSSPPSGTRGAMDETVRRVERYLLDVERDRLSDALRSGALPRDAYDRLVAELDERRATYAMPVPATGES
jgi:CPA1 family monovalent cation:H+ antiporter